MKTKITSFIFLLTFIMTAIHCSRPSNESPDTPKTPDTPSIIEELIGQYLSDDRQKLDLGYKRYDLYIKNELKEFGNYDTNEFSNVELDLKVGFMIFKIDRDSNGQIVRLIQTSSGIVFHRVIPQDELLKSLMKNSVGGQLKGILNGKSVVLVLDEDPRIAPGCLNMYREGGKRYFGLYSLEATRSGFLITINFGDTSETYNLYIKENRIEKITSMTNTQEEGLVRYDAADDPFYGSDLYPDTIERTNQIRQNLIGVYEGNVFDETDNIAFDIKADGIDLIIDGRRISYLYRTIISTSDFSKMDPSTFSKHFRKYENYPSLFFQLEGTMSSYLEDPSKRREFLGTLEQVTRLDYFITMEHVLSEPNLDGFYIRHFKIVFAPNSDTEVIGLDIYTISLGNSGFKRMVKK